MSTSLAPNVRLLAADTSPAEIELVEGPALPESGLVDGDVLVRVEKFGFSSNNVTYAALGRSLRYFDFFPSGRAGWGSVPVWGMGTVEQSRSDLAVGTRFYGFLPLARWTTLRPRSGGMGFEVDRGDLPGVYNRYGVAGIDPFMLPAQEDASLIFRPVVLTGILLDDYLDAHDGFGADTVLVSSASSKTSIGLAFAVARRRASGEASRTFALVGLTSKRHAAWVKSLGLYDRVVAYDDLAGLPASGPVVLVDVAGDADLRRRLHAQLGARFGMIITVGMSHWDKGALGNPENALAGVRDEFFFAPSWVEKRTQDWGLPKFGATVAEGWQAFMADVGAKCRLVYGAGRDAVAAAYRATLGGASRPDEGQVLSLWDDAFTSR
jgi:hypothetical protein